MADKVLVVEDEIDLSHILEYNLRQASFEVVTASRGATAARLVKEGGVSLVLLDRMLPDISGTDVLRIIKSDPKTSRVPVIMLTARGEEIDRVHGLELGAEDYVVKPFSMRELILRIQAILRSRLPQPESERSFVSVGSLQIDIGAHRVWVRAVEVELTALELKLLLTLWERRDRVQSRAQLLERVWGVCTDVHARAVDTHVARLREKLGAAADCIATVRGLGYRFDAEAMTDRAPSDPKAA